TWPQNLSRELLLISQKQKTRGSLNYCTMCFTCLDISALLKTRLRKNKMNGKKSKKIRQLFNREYKDAADELANDHMNIFRPKPWWFPMFLWVKLIGIFFRIKQ